jgi:hypothetical protein
VSSRERPSYIPTILVTLFFSLFGLIPVILHSRMAKERGHSSSGYWIAFCSTIAAMAVFASAAVVPLIVLHGGSKGKTPLAASPTSVPNGGSSAPTSCPPSEVISHTYPKLISIVEANPEAFREYLQYPGTMVVTENPALFNEVLKYANGNLATLLEIQTISPDLTFLTSCGLGPALSTSSTCADWYGATIQQRQQFASWIRPYVTVTPSVPSDPQKAASYMYGFISRECDASGRLLSAVTMTQVLNADVAAK